MLLWRGHGLVRPLADEVSLCGCLLLVGSRGMASGEIKRECLAFSWR